ncbi:DinB family protein [Paenibacillus caui]|uniref:DinB family protein n=1 Tax=Paenibacillus caui TaxID=2873927 RepID=UPI001CA8A5FE|nr:DinB family protein [Paenibacillus caui]
MLEQNEVVRQLLWNAVAGLSCEKLNKPPARGKWSAAQVLEHLYLTERAIAGQIGITLKEGRNARAEPKPFRLVLDRSRHMATLPHLVPGDEPATLESLKSKLNQSRHALEEVLKDVDDELGKNRSFPHPEYGPMNLKQWEEFVGIHEQRHLEQIKDIVNELRKLV